MTTLGESSPHDVIFCETCAQWFCVPFTLDPASKVCDLCWLSEPAVRTDMRRNAITIVSMLAVLIVVLGTFFYVIGPIRVG